MSPLLADIQARAERHDGKEFVRRLFAGHAGAIMKQERPLVLFGTGEVGRDLCEVLQHHSIHPHYFVDNNPTKIGTEIHGVPVLSFSHLLELDPLHLILIATSDRHVEGIGQQLKDHHIQDDRIITISGLQHLELLRYYKQTTFFTENPIHQMHWQDLLGAEKEIEAAYSLLGDEKSRELYRERLALFLGPMDFIRFSDYVDCYSDINEAERATFDFYVSPEDYGYFNNEFIQSKDGEVLVDAGAYNGLSAATFEVTCKRKGVTPGKIISFEPDPDYFRLLLEAGRKITNHTSVPCGLWSKSSTQSFVCAKDFDYPGASSLQTCIDRPTIDHTQITAVQTISLDDYCAAENVTFIKADIEGAELEAILGAKNLIQRCRPKFAISAYHRHSDIYKIPLLINELSHGYRFHLRHFGYTLFDLVLFAIPTGDTAHA